VSLSQAERNRRAAARDLGTSIPERLRALGAMRRIGIIGLAQVTSRKPLDIDIVG
jgi:hypothetical protein